MDPYTALQEDEFGRSTGYHMGQLYGKTGLEIGKLLFGGGRKLLRALQKDKSEVKTVEPEVTNVKTKISDAGVKSDPIDFKSYGIPEYIDPNSYGVPVTDAEKAEMDAMYHERLKGSPDAEYIRDTPLILKALGAPMAGINAVGGAMKDDKGLFQGGRKDRLFGRFFDKIDDLVGDFKEGQEKGATDRYIKKDVDTVHTVDELGNPISMSGEDYYAGESYPIQEQFEDYDAQYGSSYGEPYTDSQEYLESQSVMDPTQGVDKGRERQARQAKNKIENYLNTVTVDDWAKDSKKIFAALDAIGWSDEKRQSWLDNLLKEKGEARHRASRSYEDKLYANAILGLDEPDEYLPEINVDEVGFPDLGGDWISPDERFGSAEVNQLIQSLSNPVIQALRGIK